MHPGLGAEGDFLTAPEFQPKAFDGVDPSADPALLNLGF
jgi:hypothetical protein